MKIIKIDFEKYTTNLTLEIFECLASLMKNYKNIIFTNISYEDILNKMSFRKMLGYSLDKKMTMQLLCNNNY